MNKRIGILLTIIGGICWGASGVAGQCLLEMSDITSRWLVPVRLLMSGILLIIYQVCKSGAKVFDIWKNRRDAIDMLIYAIVGIMLCQYTYFYTIEYSNAGTATILQYVAPVLIMGVTCFMQRRVPLMSEVLCIILALAGVFVIATHCKTDELAISPRALIVGLLSAVTVVIYNIQPMRLMRRYSAVYLLAWALLVGGAVISLIFKPWECMPMLNIKRILLVCVTVVVGSVMGFSLYLNGVKMIGATSASVIASMEPVTAAVLSVAFLGSQFTVYDLIGFLLIISTIIILATAKDKISSEVSA